jgi:hypothetical protein
VVKEIRNQLSGGFTQLDQRSRRFDSKFSSKAPTFENVVMLSDQFLTIINNWSLSITEQTNSTDARSDLLIEHDHLDWCLSPRGQAAAEHGSLWASSHRSGWNFRWGSGRGHTRLPKSFVELVSNVANPLAARAQALAPWFQFLFCLFQFLVCLFFLFLIRHWALGAGGCL